MDESGVLEDVHGLKAIVAVEKKIRHGGNALCLANRTMVFIGPQDPLSSAGLNGRQDTFQTISF